MKRDSNFSLRASLRDLWQVIKALAAEAGERISSTAAHLSRSIRRALAAASWRREERAAERAARRDAERKAKAQQLKPVPEQELTGKPSATPDTAVYDSPEAAPKKRPRRQRDGRRRNEYRSRIQWRTVGQMVLFSLLYWGAAIGFALLSSYGSGLASAVEDFARDILSWFGIFYWVYNNMSIILAVVYVICMIAIPMRALSRTAGHIDRIYQSAATVLDGQQPVADVPREVRDIGTLLREIKVTMTQSEQSAKEADQRKNDLVVYLAHDLKTPLASIIGYLSLLEEAPELPVEQRAKYTSITLNKAYRLEQLINEFFDITRFNLQSVELESNRIDLSFMLGQIADEFYPVLEEKGLDISLTMPRSMPVVGDADKLARVFDNLLRNAVSYSYPETTVSILTRLLDTGEVEIRVRNVGDEIPRHTLERLFEKFFRADSARRTSTGGSGLGLAIARQIVELHSGSISASSSPEFTEFCIILPIAAAEAAENQIVRFS